MSTQDLLGQIKDLGEHNQSAIDQLVVKQQRMESDLLDMKRKSGTAAIFGANQEPVDPFRKALLDNTENIERFARKAIKEFSFEVKTVGDMGFSANYTGTPAATYATPVAGIVGSAYRKAHVRELLRQTYFTGSALPVIKENGAGEGGFANQVEGETKSQIDFDVAEVDAKAQTLAAFLVVSRQMMDDVPSFVSWIGDRMKEAYFKAEDTQLLTGNGTGVNLSGLNNTGNFTAATTVATDDVLKLIEGIGQMWAADRNPTGILLHPTDCISILARTASGSGEFDLPSYVSVNNAGQLTILGIPCVCSTAQTLGTYNIIDNSGMLLGIRENLQIQFFEQDNTNVRQNKVTVRAESRLAFPIYGASFNIKGAF